MFAQGSDAAQSPADQSAEFEHLEGGRDVTFQPSHCAWPHSDPSGEIKLQKGVIGWVLAPYHVSRDCRVR